MASSITRVELVDGLVYADHGKRSGIPCIVDCHYSVSDVLRYLGGQMSREELLEVTALDEDRLGRILAWVAQVVNDNGVPKPTQITGVLRRRGQTLADVWRKMGQQPHEHPHYRVTQRLADVAPDLVTAIEQIAIYV